MPPFDALRNLAHAGQAASIDSLALDPALHILALAPHPDDFDAIGATLRYFQRCGNEILLTVLGGGSKGVLDDPDERLTWVQKAASRAREHQRSCEFFGLPGSRVRFLRLNEAAAGELGGDAVNADRVRQQLKSIAPDILCLPYGDDSNCGHRRAYRMLRSAARHLAKPLLALYNRDAKSISFHTDLYFAFGAAQDEWKRELAKRLEPALACAEPYRIELFLP